MEYTQVQLGRVFIIRLDNGDDLLDSIKQITIKENIKTGFAHIIGACSKSNVVLGPKERSLPPVPYYWNFDDARELLGFAFIAQENNEPKIHLHSGIGHYTETKLGCIRNECNVFLTVEAVIQEVISNNITRKYDVNCKASLLNFE